MYFCQLKSDKAFLGLLWAPLCKWIFAHFGGPLVPPFTSPPLIPTLMSMYVNQSIQAIGHQVFHGIFDFMMKNVILTILAILGVGEDPYKRPVDLQDSTRGPSEGPSPFYQPPQDMFWLLTPHSLMAWGLIWYMPTMHDKIHVAFAKTGPFFTQTKILSERNKLESCATLQMKAENKSFKTFF